MFDGCRRVPQPLSVVMASGKFLNFPDKTAQSQLQIGAFLPETTLARERRFD
jgi:hypothetical protein